MINISLDEAEALLKERLKETRYLHSLNVAAAAKELALIYGEDPDRAYEAGLLHDITKNTSDEEQLKIIEKGGIILTPVEKNNPKLYHSISGSVYIRDELGETDEEIISAVRYHTTGKAGMTLLEKIIYIADFISAERTFNGVDYMRNLAKISLDDACMFAVDFCIPDLVRRKKVIHPDSLGLYNDLIIKNS